MNFHLNNYIFKIKVFINGNPLAGPIIISITKSIRIQDIAKKLQESHPNSFKQLRLFNQEGVEMNQDDLQYLKNDASLFASAGEDFDSNSTFSEYEMVKELGRGGFGKVMLGVHKTTKEKVAIKVIDTRMIGNAQDIDMVFREAEIMKSLNHNNIIKIKNCFTLTNMQVVFVMEYLQGGELLAKVEQKGRLSEQEAKIYFRQIVEAMAYCHRNKLIHRDLKLENILLTNNESNEIKIVDFGIAGCIANVNVDHLDAGSLRYMAPEILSQKITKLTSSIDVWSMGVILYCMLMGQLPFYAESNSASKELICQGNYTIPSNIGRNLSPECKNVLSQILDVNPATRISTIDLLNHPWIRDQKMSEQYEEHREDHSNDLNRKDHKSFMKPQILNPAAASISSKPKLPISQRNSSVGCKSITKYSLPTQSSAAKTLQTSTNIKNTTSFKKQNEIKPLLNQRPLFKQKPFKTNFK